MTLADNSGGFTAISEGLGGSWMQIKNPHLIQPLQHTDEETQPQRGQDIGPRSHSS